jgi:hypothetical protein
VLRWRYLGALWGLLLLGDCEGKQFVASKYFKSQWVVASQGATLTVTPAESAVFAGTRIIIPAGALSADTRIGVGYGNSGGILPSAIQYAGRALDLGPDDAQFPLPVTVHMPFELPAGAVTAQLVVEAQELNGSTYQVPNGSLTVSAGFVDFTVTGFTQFQPGVAIPPPPDAGDGGLDGGDGGLDGGDGGSDGGDGGSDGGDGGLDGGDGGAADAGTCFIGGQYYESGALNDLDRMQCCNPANDAGWSALFTKGPTYSIGLNVATVVVADFNADTEPDIAVSAAGNTVWVFLNKGDGTFSSPLVITTKGPQYGGLAAADLNGDGLPDLIVANSPAAGLDAGSVGVLLNLGDGGFANELDFAATCNVARVSVADFNGDGWPDVLAGEISCGGGVFLNAQDGGALQPEVLYDPGFSFVAQDGIGDFDGDGKLDFALNHGVPGGKVAIYLDDGDGGFQSPLFNSSVPIPWGMAVGKLGIEPVDDLVVTSYTTNQVFVIGQNLGGLDAGTAYDTGSLTAVVADLDRDGSQDFLSNDGNGNLYASFNKGDGTFWPPASMDAGAAIQWFTMADLNRDGALDIAIISYSPSSELTIWYAGCP